MDKHLNNNRVIRTSEVFEVALLLSVGHFAD